MNEQIIKIPRASDKEIATAFIELGNKYGVSHADVSTLGFVHFPQVELAGQTNADWTTLLDHNAYLIHTLTILVGDIQFTYRRGGPDTQTSPIYDEIKLNGNQNKPAPLKDKIDTIALLTKKLIPFEPFTVAEKGDPEMQRQILAIHHTTLQRLEQLSEDLIRKNVEYQRKLEEKFETKANESEEALRREKERLATEADTLSRDLYARECVLSEKLKLVDDRDNTHVRREIRDKMLADVKERITHFGVSEATMKKRSPVFFGVSLLIGIFAALLIWTGFEISTFEKAYVSSAKIMNSTPPQHSASEQTTTPIYSADNVALYWLWTRFALFVFGLAGTVLYYIKWQNKWAEQHATSEFQLQQFHIDVNRANWVIESCLEWRKETDSPIPKELLTSITNGLFANVQAETERVIHPADELASALMGSASKIKLKLGDNEMEFDKPKKIPKQSITANEKEVG